MKEQGANRMTIVITGSTRGIGYGLAREFVNRGNQVIINGREEGPVRQRVEEFKALNYEAEGVAGDIVDPETHRLIIEKAVNQYGRIDIWINNAGIPQSYRYFHELEDEEITRLVSVDIAGMMAGTKAAINFFRKQGFGKIFNMEGFGSDGRTMDKLTVYGTTKRAVHYFTRAVSGELGGENIQVGTLSPGMVRTDFITAPLKEGDDREQARFKRVLEILAEDPEPVTQFLVERILKGRKKYHRIRYLTARRMIPKILKLMFIR